LKLAIPDIELTKIETNKAKPIIWSKGTASRTIAIPTSVATQEHRISLLDMRMLAIALSSNQWIIQTMNARELAPASEIKVFAGALIISFEQHLEIFSGDD
jgi:hypothetical protein